MSCSNAVEIKDEHGYRYAITGPFLQEYDIEPPNHSILADRVVLLYQIGRAIRSQKASKNRDNRLDALYTQCGLYYNNMTGNNVNTKCFSVTKNSNEDIWIGCKHFAGDNAKTLIQAARQAWKEVRGK